LLTGTYQTSWDPAISSAVRSVEPCFSREINANDGSALHAAANDKAAVLGAITSEGTVKGFR
jgi:hypothetical protein